MVHAGRAAQADKRADVTRTSHDAFLTSVKKFFALVIEVGPTDRIIS
jgi:hypothetical protein